MDKKFLQMMALSTVIGFIGNSAPTRAAVKCEGRGALLCKGAFLSCQWDGKTCSKKTTCEDIPVNECQTISALIPRLKNCYLDSNMNGGKCRTKKGFSPQE